MSRRCRKVAKSQTCPADARRDDINHVLNVSHVIWNTVVPIAMGLEDMPILGEAFFPLRALCYKAMAAPEKKIRAEELASHKKKRNPRTNAKYTKATRNGRAARTRQRNAEIINTKIFGTVCRAGALEFAKWIREKKCIPMSDFLAEPVLCICCNTGQIEMVKWLFSEFDLDSGQLCYSTFWIFNSRCFYCACVNGHLDLAKWLYSTFQGFREVNFKTRINNPRYTCLSRGHAHVVKWLDEIVPFPYWLSPKR